MANQVKKLAAEMNMATPEAAPARDIAAVVVAYHPPHDVVELVKTLSSVGCHVWVVDNTPHPTAWLTTDFSEGVRVLAPGKNLGVAGAYNLVLRALQEQQSGVDSLFLFDQDSRPDAACLNTLVSAMRELRERGEAVAQVGPAYYERQRAFFPPLIEVGRWRLRRTPLSKAQALHPVSYMISSGSLISLDAIRRVGEFDEGLFIDYVDIEFGFRCQYAGLSSWIVRAATMEHAIGESPLRLGKWTLPAHSALRRRYQARNSVLLMRRPEIPTIWKIHEAVRALMRFVFMLVVRDSALPGQAVGWCRGVWDGILGKKGGVERKV